MSTQSYPAMAVNQIMTDGRERTRSANVAHGQSRSTATRNETDPPLRRGRRLRHLEVSTDPQTRPIARPLGAVVSAYDLPCNHARHNLPASYWRFTLDFVLLNACTGGLEGWPIPNILKVLECIGTLKPKMFGLIDFTRNRETFLPS